MAKKSGLFLLIIALLAVSQLAMARQGQYDEEAREAERLAQQEEKPARSKNPLKNIAGGVKQATVDNATDVISETTAGAQEGPVTGTLEGARKSTGKVLDNTVKGVAKVATLGYADTSKYEVQEPEHGKDEPTKVKFRF